MSHMILLPTITPLPSYVGVSEPTSVVLLNSSTSVTVDIASYADGTVAAAGVHKVQYGSVTHPAGWSREAYKSCGHGTGQWFGLYTRTKQPGDTTFQFSASGSANWIVFLTGFSNVFHVVDSIKDDGGYNNTMTWNGLGAYNQGDMILRYGQWNDAINPPTGVFPPAGHTVQTGTYQHGNSLSATMLTLDDQEGGSDPGASMAYTDSAYSLSCSVRVVTTG